MNIKKDILYRIYFCFLVIALFGFAILFRAFKIQTENDGHWAKMADSLSTALISIPAERGNVYSSDGHLLATSLPTFELRIDFASDAMTDDIFYSNVEALAQKMAENFKDKSKEQYKNMLVKARKSKNRYFLLKRNVDYRMLNDIKEWPLFSLGKYKGGLIVITHQKRKKPYGTLAERTIGYTRSNAQNIGLEAVYDEYLSGVQGKRLMQRIAGGNWIPLTDENAINPKDGADIITTINLNIQDVAEDALMRTLQTHNAEYGCVIVMEVETGAIRAISNLSLHPDGRYIEEYNYAVGSATEPGSTFKVASYLAMLEQGCLSLDDSVYVSKGSTTFFGYPMKDVSFKKDYLTAEEVLARSSNIGTAKFALKCFKDNQRAFFDKLQAFHLFEETGINLPGEAKPYITPYEKFSKLSLPWMSTGYEVQLTPLQTLRFYNAIANNGKMVSPYLVEKIVDKTKAIKTFKPEVIDNKIASKESIELLKKLMLSVVETGTAKSIKPSYYTIAGKTGTAKINDPRTGYSVKKYQASFAGFFPVENPKYSAIVVVVSREGQLLHGGSIAAPVFKEISDRIMGMDTKFIAVAEPDSTLGDGVLSFISSPQYVFNISDKFDWKYNQIEQGEYFAVNKRADKVELLPINIQDNIIPNVKGMFADEAISLLEERGIRVNIVGRGKVISQSIKPGEKLIKGSVILLELS